ncbi:hypothetical protein KKC88_00145 [Patescibacteria group bacterium]|nr:hypothetical protein [Patescibacteria group bacterium]MBU1673041.1 hypothetical protein [Patescibacteria group bacterium]MBU1963601.1 hypothetical protein [Patescibacteria group bacterium]
MEKKEKTWATILIIFIGILILIWIFYSIKESNNDPLEYSNTVPEQQGNLKDSGGTPTIRKTYVPETDDPYTSDNEYNDQPVGYYGTETMEACNLSSGNCYDLDVEIYGDEIERIYFPKGGWVDMYDSEWDEYSGEGWGEDENGTEWEFYY